MTNLDDIPEELKSFLHAIGLVRMNHKLRKYADALQLAQIMGYDLTSLIKSMRLFADILDEHKSKLLMELIE